MKLTIKQINEKLATISKSDDPFFLQCKKDSRVGVQQLVQRWEKNEEIEKGKQQQFYNMLSIEREVRSQGYTLIAGIDEVGRGPLAGPVVAAAVILKDDCYLPGLTDSKKLSATARETFFNLIHEQAQAIGIGIVSSEMIDKVNIYEATKLAMINAIEELEVSPDYLLLDAMKVNLPISQQSIIKGDAKSITIAASSVIAKVTRDRLMNQLASQYPEYGFEKHMGYGTKQHLEAIKQYGVLKEHRQSFAPIKEMV
ncbi:ribonuclease HII [Bacillus weihaiensis]|uniref:Ribonuclease HII n=1 Tax=Bacillus weihaiensis TaxID=1547283 RepID=A0A1L3MSG2_9BACI|nr:ribonuclease HII [Bacillus weihaiensis]APH05276.1 ribonuclease HII [Bacillus weihaiensis]